jgi:hypothetical protein
MIFYRDKANILIHEDFVFPKESAEVIKWLEKNIPEAELFRDEPPIGLGYTLDTMIRQKLTSKYTFYTQEDWEFERPIDLDQLMWVMDQNPEINLIFFNKIRNLEIINDAPQTEFMFSGMKFCLYHSWTFLPGLWRTDFVKKHWRARQDRPEGYFTNAFGTHEQRMSVDYCQKNIGAYMLGAQMDYRYSRHIGNDWRMASWRLEAGGKPGGCHDKTRMDLPFMAPWIEYKDRPVRRKPDKEIIENLMNEEPKETGKYVKENISNDGK